MTPEEAAAENEKLIRDYKLCFGSPAGESVMLDLMKFCRFRRPLISTGEPMDRIPIHEGRREVFLRIMNFMALSPEQIMALYGGHSSGGKT